MNLTEAQVTGFQRIYKKQFNVHLTRVEALEQGLHLARLMQLVYKPIKNENKDNDQEQSSAQ